tara:strand:+ start:19111 stop:19809 length:699 start_codon:yes stop_codon:yes gene_type:complete
MAFFEKLPDLLYASKITKSGFGDYTRIKNVFRMYKLSDNAKRHAVQFYKYNIPEGSTPEMVALDIYNSPNFHWVVLMVNEVVDVYEGWPKDRDVLEKYTAEKYAPDKIDESTQQPFLDGRHHYETLERKDNNGNIVMRAGLQVDDGWTQEVTISSSPSITKTLTIANDCVEISNFKYEERINDSKREIELLKPSYLPQFVKDFEAITSYEANSDLEDKRTKKTAIDLVRKYY